MQSTPPQNGCIPAGATSNRLTVTVKPKPIITIRPSDTTVIAGTQLPLQAFVSGNMASYEWTPANSLTSSQTLSPVSIPLQTSTRFLLYALGDNGCDASGEAIVRVLTRLYMPNTFTPNGDGKNDVFRIPPAVSLQLKEFAVFDRWGNPVFKTTDISKGWDGRYKGKALPANTYVYSILGWDDNQAVHVKGTVLLIR